MKYTVVALSAILISTVLFKVPLSDNVYTVLTLQASRQTSRPAQSVPQPFTATLAPVLSEQR